MGGMVSVGQLPKIVGGKLARATSDSLLGVLFPAESPCRQSHRENGPQLDPRGMTLTRQLLPA